MRNKIITFVAILAAVVGWWGILELGNRTRPDQPGMLVFFFCLLFLAVTATLIPAFAYLNRRFAPEAGARDRLRFLRHSAWGGICVVIWAWLQIHRVFELGFAFLTILIFIAIEFLITRLRPASGA
jgi:hypothetical protein